MFDIWAFLLQTLNVSGVAALVLAVKALFKDKLPPKWQFAVWSILGVFILFPTGAFGTYTLVRWQTVVEIIKSMFSDYSFTRVFFPFPIAYSSPQTLADWLFLLYTVGVVFSLLFYLISYLRLKYILRFGRTPSDGTLTEIRELAAEQGITSCRVIEIAGLPSAFVFGIFRPTLVIPEGKEIDDKIILHELFHLKNRDTLWSLVICILRSLHWCNPLVVYCAHRALADMESRCDQYVLESVFGEERREYGKILLSMTNEKFSGIPGSTSIHNGGKNIRARIENIARFKKYPKGMKLVSVCVFILLAFPLVTGAKAATVHEFPQSIRMTLASARSTPCTTYAGAFDAYGKAILDRNGYYRAMCAPESLQQALEAEMLENNQADVYPNWNSGLDEWANEEKGYQIYNLTEVEKNIYEGLFVVELHYPANGKPAEFGVKYLAVQMLRAEKENGRWVIVPLEDFRHIESIDADVSVSCFELPGIVYVGEINDFRVEITFQTVHTVDSTVTKQTNFGFPLGSYYDTTPNPNATFNYAAKSRSAQCIYLGEEADKDRFTHIGLVYSPVEQGEKRPVLSPLPNVSDGSGGSNTGGSWTAKPLKSEWNSTVHLNGGSSIYRTSMGIIESPQYYAADLYLNGDKVAELDLYPLKGGSDDE